MRNFIFPGLVLLLLACKKELAIVQDVYAPSPMRCAPQLTDADWYSGKTQAPLFNGMDILSYPVTTKSPEAQKYFNQGLLLAYAFNHAEAARSFYQAIRLDSTCAMCYWGFAYVLGPNYNSGMEPDHYARAHGSIQKALKYASNSTPKEKELIKAMAARYVAEPVENRYALDSAYMLAMKTVHARYPEDVDIAALYAESLMDMHPWDLWDKEGNPRSWTPEILKAIEMAISINPNHPGGHHFYIHALEASNEPEKALVSCKVFDDGLVPNAGHLVHMPSHIYINTGDYHKGTVANIKAVERDSQYVTQCHAQGSYPLAYYPHNYHFLAACATLEGNSKWALLAAEKMSDHTNHKGMLLEPLVTLQHFYSIPYFVQVKFAMWNDILKEGPPDSVLLYPNGIYHYAKGMAHLGIGQLDKAQLELDALNLVEKEDTLKKLTIWGFNSLHQVISIAKHVLAGELAAAKGDYDEAVRLLKAAIEIEDQLLYQEPPDWFFSVRHHLGAILLDAKKPQDAISYFEEDLETYPKNGWALSGLKQAYEDLNKKDQAAVVDAQLREAWAYADVKIAGGKVK